MGGRRGQEGKRGDQVARSLGVKPFKPRSCLCLWLSFHTPRTRHRETGTCASDSFPERRVFPNFVNTQDVLVLALLLPLCSLTFSALVLTALLFPLRGVFSLLSSGFTGTWWKLGEGSGELVLCLTFPASSSAPQFPLWEGARHSFVCQVFYFCSSWIFQFSGCFPGQRLPKLLFNKHCPPHPPSWEWAETWLDGRGSV